MPEILKEEDFMDESDLQERRQFLSEMEAYLGRNELRAVLNLAQARLKKTPGDLEARIVICRVWLQQGRFDEAREMLGEMEEILSGFSRIYACMGDICLKKGMEDAAEVFFRKFRVLNPEVSPARDILQRLDEIGENPGQESAPAGDEVPIDFQTVTLAELYIRQGHLGPAEEILEKIVGDDPLNGKAAGLLADVRELIAREAARKLKERVSGELSRWLGNVDRLRDHAA
jgi:tetratricopeptide (TPR) repeat protein